MRLGWIAATVVGLGCGNVKDDPGGASDGGADAPSTLVDGMVITECPVGTTFLCNGADAVTCDGDGAITSTTTCDLGCNADAERCNKVNPSNALAAALDDAAGEPDLVLVGDATINTDTGVVTDSTGTKTPATETLSSGLPVAVFVIKAKSITMDKVTVSGVRALALVADGAVTLKGRLAADAQLDAPGAGAMLNDVGCQGATAGSNADGRPGGGGGGFGSVGGRGGSGGLPVIAGAAGGAVSGNEQLVPLRGGCTGGNAGGQSNDASTGAPDPGAGGGAIQIVSNTQISLEANSAISVNGGGGKGNTVGNVFCIANTPCGWGEGGGSGGAILLEAPRVTVDTTAQLAANGGAGTCVLNGSAPNGGLGISPAIGSTCSGDNGSGGNGAAGATAATNGGNGLNDDPVGGGGGGGVGRIRVNVVAGQTFQPAGLLSPAQSVGVLPVR